jgi:hypothetical protein
VIAASDAPANVKAQADYVCDGVSDNVQIQAALDILESDPYGGIVQLTNGLFNISDTILIPDRSYITLCGFGATSTNVYLSDNTNKPMIAKRTPGNLKYRDRIMDLELQGNSTNNATGTYGIDCTGMAGLTISNVYIYDCKSHGFYANGVNGVTLRDTRAASNKGAGYYFANIAGWMFDTIWSFDNSLQGFTIQTGWENFGVNISCDLDLGDSFSLSGVHRSHFQNMWVAPLTQWYYGLNFYNCSDVSINGGSHYPPAAASANARGAIITASVSNCTNIVISDFSFDGTLNSSNHCIRQVEAGGGVISGVKFIDCSFVGFVNVFGTAVGNIRMERNVGYITENSGLATVLNTATSIVVNHGLATTPTRVLITPIENPTNPVSFWWVDTLTATQFTIHVNADPGASNLDFDWRAVIGEGN